MCSSQIIPTLHPELARRKQVRLASGYPELWECLDEVCDPELPGLSLWDLGVLQDVQVSLLPQNQSEPSTDALKKAHIKVIITPTYSGCPAVDAMKSDAITALHKQGYENVNVAVTLTPAWNTNMMSARGKKHLLSLNIAPPMSNAHDAFSAQKNDIEQVQCPQCASTDTILLSQFGSTACKAIYRCQQCAEVFDYFKRL